jgi:hypothetical protein
MAYPPHPSWWGGSARLHAAAADKAGVSCRDHRLRREPTDMTSAAVSGSLPSTRMTRSWIAEGCNGRRCRHACFCVPIF